MRHKFKYSYFIVVPPVSAESRIQIGPKRKIAFVCSGGATKAGAFHLGVALALQEQGFRFVGGPVPADGKTYIPSPMDISLYVGSSAGSIISSYLAAGYSLNNIFNSFLDRNPDDSDILDRIPKVLPRLTYQKMFKVKPSITREHLNQLLGLKQALMELKNGHWESFVHSILPKMTGFFSTSGIEQYMREDVLPSNRFKDYVADLFIVATQLNHSRKVVFGKYSFQPPPHDITCQYDNHAGISEACAASTALPLFFSPYAIKNSEEETFYYIDGEIRDTLSTHVAVDGGADLIFASYTHQPLHMDGTTKTLTDFGLPAIIIQSIYLLIEQKIKNHIHNKIVQRTAIDAVSRYCKSVGISDEHRSKICDILEGQLHHRPNVDTIYIHPSPTDSQLFFGEHFSLSSKKMTDIVKAGFRATIDTLRKYQFADRPKRK